jgi:hypothetical protein
MTMHWDEVIKIEVGGEYRKDTQKDTQKDTGIHRRKDQHFDSWVAGRRKRCTMGDVDLYRHSRDDTRPHGHLNLALFSHFAIDPSGCKALLLEV